MLLDVFLIMRLRKILVKLLSADRTLTLLQVLVDMVLDLEESFTGKFHLTYGAVGDRGRLGEAVRSRCSRSQLWYGGPGGQGGQRVHLSHAL